MNSTLKSLFREHTPPLLMDSRKDGSIVVHWPSELKSTHLRIVDDKGMTIPVPAWMTGSRAGIPDWEKKYFTASALFMMANNGNGGFSMDQANRWDAAFYLGIMWERFRVNRGAKIEISESVVNAEEMDAIVKRFSADA